MNVQYTIFVMQRAREVIVQVMLDEAQPIHKRTKARNVLAEIDKWLSEHLL